jgi:hypothetical protein
MLNAITNKFLKILVKVFSFFLISCLNDDTCAATTPQQTGEMENSNLFSLKLENESN